MAGRDFLVGSRRIFVEPSFCCSRSWSPVVYVYVSGAVLVGSHLAVLVANDYSARGRLYLFLWGVSLCYPLIGLFLKVETSANGVLYYMSGYAGYFLLGYYLKHYGLSLRFRTVVLGFVLAALAPVIVKVMHWEVDFYSLFWYLSIFVAVQCIFWWQVIHKVMAKVKGQMLRMVPFLIMISNLSFGIYLSHVLVMRVGLWHINFILGIPSYVCQTVVIALLTLVLATMFSYILSKLPLGNVFIGYRSRL